MAKSHQVNCQKKFNYKPNFYGQSKYLAEQILSEYCKTISLRLPAVLGKVLMDGYPKFIQNVKQ